MRLIKHITIPILLGTCEGMNFFQKFLSMKYQQAHMNGANTISNLGLSQADQQEVLLNVNNHAPGMGYSPLEMMLAKTATKTQLVDDLKQGHMDNLRYKLQTQNTNPLTDILIPYAKETSTSGRSSADDVTTKEAFAQYVHEPMRTIMLLKSHSNADVRSRGTKLFKKAISRCLQHPTKESRDQCRSTNPMTNSSALIDMLLDNDKEGIKRFIVSQNMQQQQAMKQAFGYRAFTGQDTSTSTNSNSDLLKNQFASEAFPDQVNAVAPNDAYLMFRFIHDAAKADAGRIPANVILDVAFGNDVMDIKASEFKENFGVSATDYICTAHEETLRVPCLVNQATVTQPECAALGCCYNRLTEDGSSFVDSSQTPICYHNVLGKVGAGIARHMIKKENLIGLFGGIDNWPQLSDLTEARTWAETQMPDILRRMVQEPGSFYGNPRGQASWWGNVFDKDDSKFKLFPKYEQTNTYRKRNFKWKPHGPTAMPGAAHINIAEIGGYLSGSDPRAKELDFVIGNHVNKVRGQLNSQSYTCQLIAKEHMNDCYPHNYAALSTEKDGKDPAAACEEMGCCYNEMNFFEDPTLPVCYRSLRSGYCDAPIAERGTGTRSDLYWKNHPHREPCGGPDITRFDCLKQNGYCCFDTNPRRDGDPFCYRRGGVESQINPYTKSKGEAIDECLTVPLPQRVNCFHETSKFGRLLNKMASEHQCGALGCCYDQAAADASIKMGLFGSMSLAAPHCYKGPDDLDHTLVNSNYRKLPRYGIGQLIKVCAHDPKWPKLKQRQWVKGSNGRMTLRDVNTERELSREPCLHEGRQIYDRHKCIYTKGCCFEKHSNPIHPWCYRSRLVVNN